MTSDELSASTPSAQRPASSARLAIRLQRGGGLAFAIFLTLHLISVLGGLGGEAVFNRLVSATRAVYQYLPLELALLAAVGAHVWGSLLRWWRRPAGAELPAGIALQGWAGFILLLFFVGHVLFTRVIPGWLGFKADFGYVRLTLEIWPTFFIPYYAALGAAGAYHLIFGLFQFLRRPLRSRWPVALAVSLVFLVLPVRMAVGERAWADEELLRYLGPVAVTTPWLLDAAEEDPLVRRYQALAGEGNRAESPDR